MTGNNTPVFFVRDPLKFVDFIHTQKKDPRTNLKSATNIWDFWGLTPESTHQVTILMSDRGTPDGYRHMHGFSSHTFRWINKQGEAFWVKLHFITQSGIKNLTAQQASDLSVDPDYATRDLVKHLDDGKTAEWILSVQVIPEKDGFNYKWNIFDVTKVVPHKDYPLIPIGRLVLNRNVENYFAETEQVAYSPGHLVPGM
jgi:catalase